MKLAMLRSPARQVASKITRCSPRATFRTMPVVMRQGGSGSDLPAPTGRDKGSLLGFPSYGLSPFGSRFRDIEHEMENMMKSFLSPLDVGMEAMLPRANLSLAVDIKDTGDAFEISADVPGMNKEDVKIEVSPNRVLTVSGERKSETKEEDEKGAIVRLERSYGSFTRSFRLPEHVDTSAIKAEMNSGVLKLTVPKKEVEEAKQTITIQVGGEEKPIEKPELE